MYSQYPFSTYAVPGSQLSPQGWLSNALSGAAPFLSQLPGVGNIAGGLAGAAGNFGQQTGLFNAGPQQQLSPQGWLSSVLGGASPFLSLIPGVGPVLGGAAGLASSVGQGTGLFNAGPQQQLSPQSLFGGLIPPSLSSLISPTVPSPMYFQSPNFGGSGGQGTGLFNAGPQQQLSPQGWLSSILSGASPFLSHIPGVGGIAGGLAGAAGNFGQQTGLFNAGPQQQQLSPQGWLSNVLSGASPFLSQLPGVGGLAGSLAGAAGGFGQQTGLFSAGPQFTPWFGGGPGNSANMVH